MKTALLVFSICFLIATCLFSLGCCIYGNHSGNLAISAIGASLSMITGTIWMATGFVSWRVQDMREEQTRMFIALSRRDQ